VREIEFPLYEVFSIDLKFKFFNWKDYSFEMRMASQIRHSFETDFYTYSLSSIAEQRRRVNPRAKRIGFALTREVFIPTLSIGDIF